MSTEIETRSVGSVAREMSRRAVLGAGLAVGAGLVLPGGVLGVPLLRPRARAEACIFIWLPGGVAQTDTFDPKAYSPFEAGMKGSELLGTCPSIPTTADGVRFGAGLEGLASVMDRGCVLRTLTSDAAFGAIHLKAQYNLMTGYLFPVGVKAPSIGAVVSRTLGRRHRQVPAYIYIGRDIDTSDEERTFISEYLGSGFYGLEHAPFMIPEPSRGLATLSAAAGMSVERLDQRQAILRGLHGASAEKLRDSAKAQEYMALMAEARAMMDSPVKKAFEFSDERPEVLAAYSPGGALGAGESLLDPSYDHSNRFGPGLLLARRLVEAGARFVQVEYQYGPFKGFDMHENGARRMREMKRQIDGPITRLVLDLEERGMLDTTLVVVATEFGRTIASQPAAGVEPDGAAESHSGEHLVVANESMYGFHGHFSSCKDMLFFGGGFRRGVAYGATADRHPLLPVEKPVSLIDTHATIYAALGIAPDTSYETEGRPFYVTKDGKGKPIAGLLA
ncbi:MAG: DUF1501 domain-containing protein [Phycisphaerales bacterium]|nr:DUF1501 domain-containing protein [Phycisphaerales bacterium]